MKVTISFTGS